MSDLSVLVIGSGGREHALAWKLAQSPLVGEIYIAPGNPGTAMVGTNVAIAADDTAELLTFARDKAIGLTVVGPEAPLAAGIVDAFQDAGLPIFGPTQAAAQLEASKAYAKAFMQEVGIPTAQAQIFTDYDTAVTALANVSASGVVIKASGLAAGKGVIVCDTTAEAAAALHDIMQDRAFGAAGDSVLIEERLTGPEVSLLAFCDGKTAVPLIPARDHKRAYDHDAGPNTGGMGAFAPPPDVDADLVAHIMATVIQPTVTGMAARGVPYVGVLYAGLMLTPNGPKVLEFNCRFGDPETQVVLPMLDGDLAEIMLACIDGTLSPEMVRVKPDAAATVVMAAPGYPGSYPKGLPITGLDTVPADVTVFHAGTKAANGQIVTSGGRVLAVSALGEDVATAVSHAYAGIAQIHFDGAHYRTDIGRGAGEQRSRGDISSAPPPLRPSAYAAAGVDIAAGSRATELMKTAVHATFGPEVLSGVGNFGGLFAINAAKEMDAPVLVASTDGVGTKTMVAAAMQRWDSIGHDIVNHCINDILVQGARPLFFLDYVASAKLNPEQIATVVGGIAAACKAAGCALLGGETAEMPGVYQQGELDLVGTVVGLVDQERIVDGRRIQPGDVVLGLPSSGLHTNGYTLARTALADLDWHFRHPDLGDSVGNVLLTPHRSYLADVQALWDAGVDVRGLAHITGGGLIDNPPRILPDGCGMVLHRSSWPVPPIFGLIQQHGRITDAEMAHVFNLGLGMLVILPAAQAAHAQQTLPDAHLVGEIIIGNQTVTIGA